MPVRIQNPGANKQNEVAFAGDISVEELEANLYVRIVVSRQVGKILLYGLPRCFVFVFFRLQ